MASFPEIRSERLLLRNFSSTDINSVVSIISKGLVTELHDTTISDIAQVEAMLKKRIFRNIQELDYSGKWAIVLESDPSKLIGSCGYHNSNRKCCSVEICYRLYPEYRNRGYAYEAVTSMIDYCFSYNFPFYLNRISAITNTDSSRSISLLKKIGFLEDGILLENNSATNSIRNYRWFSLLRNAYLSGKS
ncbi:MAG: GNAT family N-acetyltransferase [Fibrobacter sp.]|nr:GNAT family N-acetyltransferase [Fibrobacter sp.]